MGVGVHSVAVDKKGVGSSFRPEPNNPGVARPVDGVSPSAPEGFHENPHNAVHSVPPKRNTSIPQRLSTWFLGPWALPIGWSGSNRLEHCQGGTPDKTRAPGSNNQEQAASAVEARDQEDRLFRRIRPGCCRRPSSTKASGKDSGSREGTIVAMEQNSSTVSAKLAVAVILVYRNTLSQIMLGACRFFPSCSGYAVEAIERHGLYAGSWMAMMRICRCRPGVREGYDPVR